MLLVLGELFSGFCTTEKSPFRVSYYNLRMKEYGQHLVLQILNGKILEFKVPKAEVKKMLGEFLLPEGFWKMLSNESLASICNDYFISREDDSMLLAINEGKNLLLLSE